MNFVKADGGDPDEDLQRIPDEDSAFRVETLSGTVHIISTVGRWTWERRPAGDVAPSHEALVIKEISDFEVGKRGYIVVSDGSYAGYGDSTHLTARITRITRDAKLDQE